MAFVRKRITIAGTVSTCLVEGYRDAQGRPRQRLLANLHGEPDTLRALARLTVRRTSLLADRKELASGKAVDDDGKRVSAAEAREVIAFIDTKLAVIAREQAVLKKHCTATAKEVRAATQAYRQGLKDAALAVLGRMMELGSLEKGLKKAKTKVRRMREG
jgi:hypothetical protein